MKTLILVIGCPRSGSSAVAGCLAEMGIALGENLLPPASDNPKGFFENRSVVTLHDQLLATVGASWDKPLTAFGPFPEDTVDRIAAIVREMPGPICAVKDPRATIFALFWAEACKREDVRLCVLEVKRDEDAIAASLEKREGWLSWRSRKLIMDYQRIAEKAQQMMSDQWGVITFPSDTTSMSAWRALFEQWDLPVELDRKALKAFIEPRLIHHSKGNGKGTPSWSVIIPSREDAKVIDCVASLIETQPDIRADEIVIVDDGLSWRTRIKLRGVTWVKGKRPFIFARAVNMGAAAIDPASDLVILGDDVRFTTPRAIERLCADAFALNCAAVAPEVVGVCGQPAQRAGSTATTADWLAFICAYIPRHAWNAVGLLDECFIGYGYDDVDWCRRAQRYGALRLAHHVRVEHLHDSSYRSREDWTAQYEKNRVIFEEKWREESRAS